METGIRAKATSSQPSVSSGEHRPGRSACLLSHRDVRMTQLAETIAALPRARWDEKRWAFGVKQIWTEICQLGKIISWRSPGPSRDVTEPRSPGDQQGPRLREVTAAGTGTLAGRRQVAPRPLLPVHARPEGQDTAAGGQQDPSAASPKASPAQVSFPSLTAAGCLGPRASSLAPGSRLCAGGGAAGRGVEPDR